MKTTTKNRRARAVALGALLASVVSLGAAADTASAAKPAPPPETVVVDVSVDAGPIAMRAGIRW